MNYPELLMGEDLYPGPPILNGSFWTQENGKTRCYWNGQSVESEFKSTYINPTLKTSGGWIWLLDPKLGPTNIV